ncbi:MAG: hypothetical protein U0Q15_00075 [Kineosporiaceae bacterium]
MPVTRSGRAVARARETGAQRRRPALVAAVVLLLSAVGWYAGPAEAVSAQATVDLTSDAAGALFDGSRPLGSAHPQTACLTVAATGAIPGDTVSVAAVGVSGALADDLRLTVEMGTGGGGGSCVGFTGTSVWSGSLTALAAVAGDGVTTGWQPALVANRTFRISAVIAAGANVAGGTSASGKFAWRLVPGSLPPVTPTPTSTTPSPSPTTTAPRPTTHTPTPTTAPPTTAVPTTAAPTTATPTPDPTTPVASQTAVPPTTSAPAVTTAVPSPDPSGTIDNSIPTTPGTPTPTRPVPTGSLGGGSGGSSDGGTSDGPGKRADVVIGAVTTVKAVPAKVGKALGSLVSTGLTTLIGPEAAERAGETVAAVIASPQYPLVVIVMAVLFLLVQYRIDARDPKLALARRRQRDDELEFADLFGVRAALARRLPWMSGPPADASGSGSPLASPLPSPIEAPPRRGVPWRR